MLSFADLRKREFSRLDAQLHTYVDYTGSALYGEKQIQAHRMLLETGIFGNPHAESPSSRASTGLIEDVRRRVLRFFDVDETTHDVVFTANTSSAVKLIAESYPFDADTSCVLSADNHNSINGIREYARRAGASVRYLPLDADLQLRAAAFPTAAGLFAFPAQSNFSGVLHPLSLVDRARAAGMDVLLDIAAFAPSHALSLRDCKADYAVLSFYKLFGYPTGIGALIARKNALAKLRRPWFAGGTVEYASVIADAHRLRAGHGAFEDGTPDFLSIAALPAGFALLEEIGMDRIAAHVERLTEMFLEEIAPFATIYGRTAFNLTDVPYWDVEERARAMNVSLRGGCFCNPGASEAAFGLEASQIAECFDALGDEFTVQRFASCAGKAVGAVRVSFGAANNEADVRRTVETLQSLTMPLYVSGRRSR
jgi:selenocysteine lyase/cysteine desulfurase